jgi:Tfp pilus assembly protein PilO
MRFKVLIVPFFIVMILVLGIGYIKPDVDAILAKKAEIASSEAQVANIEAVLANIDSLNGSLDTQQEAEKFMYRYLPDTLDQEQAIDAFNFIAVQSGLAITKMELRQPIEKAAPEPLIDPSANAFITGGDVLGGSAAPAPPVLVKTFILRGSVTGPYESIKAFFGRLAHIERFHEVRLFSLEASQETAAPGSGTAGTALSDSLTGVFEAEYGYLPPKPVPSALSMPIFLQSKFDFSNVSRLLDTITSPLPVLEKGETGRPNPFQ